MSAEFAPAKRLQRFLAFVVDRSLKGEQTALKEYGIALAVFDRDESFDTRTDTIVRVQARRLRQQLGEYYRGTGSDDPIIINLPKGSYVPVFGAREVPTVVDAQRPGRRTWMLLVGAATTLAVAASLVLWQVGILPRRPAPYSWVLEGSVLKVLDAHERFCWQKRFPPFDGLYASQVVDKVLIQDIDADGRNEVLVNILPERPAANPGSLLCFEYDGQLRWKFRYGSVKVFAGRKFEPSYMGRFLRVVQAGGKPHVLAVAGHYLWHPSQFVLLEPGSGRLLADYWHPGAVYDLRLHDVDRDGKEEAIFVAINNPGEGLGHAAVGILKIPFSKPHPAQDFGRFPPVTGGGEHAYALFPLPDQSRVMGMLPIVSRFDVDSFNRIVVQVPSPGGGIVYYLDYRLNVLEYHFADGFAPMHERLYKQGLLNHWLTPAETAALGRVVHFPAAPDGNAPELDEFWRF